MTSGDPSWASAAAGLDSLAGLDVGHRIVYRARVGSTNDLAKDLASRGALAGTVVIADEQTAGRGRLDRRWIAPPRTSLLCSILFRPGLLPTQAHRLTMLCSMAAADGIEGLTDLSVALKWPNDLVVASHISESPHERWRKLGGILTEASLNASSGDGHPELAFVVVGIGINVNVPQDALADLAPNATSTLAETGRELDRTALLKALLEAVDSRYERLRRGENPRQEWSARLATLGRRVEVTTADGVVEGMAVGVDEDGALLLRTQRGSLRRLLAGDVTLART